MPVQTEKFDFQWASYQLSTRTESHLGLGMVHAQTVMYLAPWRREYICARPPVTHDHWFLRKRRNELELSGTISMPVHADNM